MRPVAITSTPSSGLRPSRAAPLRHTTAPSFAPSSLRQKYRWPERWDLNSLISPRTRMRPNAPSSVRRTAPETSETEYSGMLVAGGGQVVHGPSLC